MNLIIEQRDSRFFKRYVVHNDSGERFFTVIQGLGFRPSFVIYDRLHWRCGRIKERAKTFPKAFDLWIGKDYAGQIKKCLTYGDEEFAVDCVGWKIKGDLWKSTYRIENVDGREVTVIHRSLQIFGATYRIEFVSQEDAIISVLTVIVLDLCKDKRFIGTEPRRIADKEEES